jgi:hypothetical protein
MDINFFVRGVSGERVCSDCTSSQVCGEFCICVSEEKQGKVEVVLSREVQVCLVEVLYWVVQLYASR